MAGQDFFARIAFDNETEALGELSETKPVEYIMKYFSISDKACDRVIEKSHKQMLEAFKEDLDRLREKYKPFMRSFTTEPQASRVKRETRNFLFRYEIEEDRKDINFVLDGKVVKIARYICSR